jgi:23S rRNA (cytidine2498-2'-O)-methyltransferase
VSDWAGGVRRFKREEGQISRAEFKLLEAMESFGLSLQAGDAALDLGAAPGGWTRVLRKYGMNVVAVDPAVLDARLASDVTVTHVREVAQSYLSKTDEQFDVILNDMRMDARDSAQIMVKAARNLKASGWALLTLKLPKKRMVSFYTSALAVMRESYDVIGARQLFHNRSEVTVALKRASSRN